MVTLALAAAFYFLPTIIRALRGEPWVGMFFANLFLGGFMAFSALDADRHQQRHPEQRWKPRVMTDLGGQLLLALCVASAFYAVIVMLVLTVTDWLINAYRLISASRK